MDSWGVNAVQLDFLQLRSCDQATALLVEDGECDNRTKFMGLKDLACV